MKIKFKQNHTTPQGAIFSKNDEFIVCGFEILNNEMTFYFFDDTSTYPNVINDEFVQITDEKYSKYWVKNESNEGTVRYMFQEWIDYPEFYRFFFSPWDFPIEEFEDINIELVGFEKYIELISDEYEK